MLVCILCILAAANGFPYSKKKITFSTKTTVDLENLDLNENPAPEEGTAEFYDSLRTVAVTSEGYEYTGSLEEVMDFLAIESEEEFIGAQSPSNDNPNLADALNMETPSSDTEDKDSDEDPSGKDGAFQLLADAMQKVLPEKRSVIGDDTRWKVSNPAGRFPFTAIGRIDTGCTGTFIAPRVALTSAHCVYDTDTDQWLKSLTIRRHKNCNPNQGTAHTWKRVLALRGWTRSHLQSYDIAVIIYRQSSPVFMQFTSASSISGNVNIFGYPGDKAGRCLWGSYCRLAQVTDDFLRYPCDTAGGMSGSAVYKYWSSTNTRTIYGVHGYGSSGSPPTNKAIRITKFYETRIKRWINDN